jgi:cytochrome P450
MTRLPGPKGFSLTALYQWMTQPFAFFEQCKKQYGDTFTFYLPRLPPLVVFSDPAVVKTVFADSGEVMHGGEFNRSLSAFLGDKSVLMVDGRAHLRKRKLLLPPFHGERMLAYGRVMMDLADEVIDGFPVNEVFAIHKRMSGIALNVIVRNVFGFAPGPKEARLRQDLEALLELMTWPPLLIPFMRVDLGRFSRWGRAMRLLRHCDETFYTELRARRATGGSRGDDILSLLIDARDEDGQPMGDAELRDELVTLLVAGHETTATALTWALRWLLATPGVEERLRGELAGVDALDPEQIQALPYLDAVVRESLRLCPIIPLVGRVLQKDLTLGGYELKKGMGVVCSIYLAQRRPEAYADPERFWPERFLDKKFTPAEFFPFGGGIRRCIGMAFALFEMKMVLARLLQRTRLQLTPRGAIRPVRRSITLMPSDGLLLRVVEKKPRSGGGGEPRAASLLH